MHTCKLHSGVLYATHTTVHQIVKYSMTGRNSNTNKHLACTAPPLQLEIQPKSIIICFSEFLHTALSVALPQRSSVHWSAERVQPSLEHIPNLQLNILACAYIKRHYVFYIFTSLSDCLCYCWSFISKTYKSATQLFK